MKNINKENKSAEILSFQNQIKSLAVEFMAIKEEIAETAVAKFEAKPSAGEAQNLLRIAKIFTSKSIAKFSEQLSKAKSIYDLAVSKVKDISKQEELTNLSIQYILPPELKEKYDKIVLLLKFNALTSMHFISIENYNMAKTVFEMSTDVSNFIAAYELFKKSKKEKKEASEDEKKALKDINNLCENFDQLITKSSIIIRRHEAWAKWLPISDSLQQIRKSNKNYDWVVKTLGKGEEGKGLNIILLSEKEAEDMRRFKQLLVDNSAIIKQLNFVADELKISPQNFGIDPIAFNNIIKVDLYMTGIDDLLSLATGKIFEESAPDPKAIEYKGRLLQFKEYPIPATEEELFKKGDNDTNAIDFNDIRQGAMGNCYFLASLMAVAQKYPNLIKDAIKINGKKGYKVRLFARTADTNVFKPVFIYIDSTFLFDKHEVGLHGAKQGDGKPGELWVMIMEKAMAKFLGGYDKIDNGGKIANILPVLTGENITDLPKAGKNYDIADLQLFLEKANTKSITIGIKEMSSIKTNLYPAQEAPYGQIERHIITHNNCKIYCKHAYLVNTVDTTKLLVTLRNPHNTYPDAAEDKDNGNITNPVVTFQFIADCASQIIYA